MRGRSIAAAALWLAVSSGCARQLRSDAFRRGMPVAVATVHSAPRVRYVRESTTMGAGGQIATHGEYADLGPASAVLPDTKRAVLHALAAARSFHVLPEEKVIGTAAYAAVPAGATSVFTKDRVAARGYKGLFTEDALGAAARRLGVEGAMQVALDHTCRPTSGGVVARVHIALSIADRDGRYVWADYTAVDSERALPDGAPPSIDALRPLLAACAERGARELLERLRQRLAAAR